MSAEPYPEHAKLAKIKDQSQKCGEFLEWLREKYILAVEHEHTDDCYAGEGKDMQRRCGTRTGDLVPALPATPTKMLAEFFEIDQDKLEKEKEQMLAELRKLARTQTKKETP